MHYRIDHNNRIYRLVLSYCKNTCQFSRITWDPPYMPNFRVKIAIIGSLMFSWDLADLSWNRAAVGGFWALIFQSSEKLIFCIFGLAVIITNTNGWCLYNITQYGRKELGWCTEFAIGNTLYNGKCQGFFGHKEIDTKNKNFPAVSTLKPKKISNLEGGNTSAGFCSLHGILQHTSDMMRWCPSTSCLGVL